MSDDAERTTVPRDDGEDSTDSPDGGERPDHLRDVPDGCGCVEVWEALSAAREADAEEPVDSES